MATAYLDLTQHHFVKSRGDLTIYGTWYGDRHRQCLVVVPTFRLNARTKPLVVPLDDGWRWNPDDPDADPRGAASQVVQFLAANGMDYLNRVTAMRVHSIIHDHIGDLYGIPPKPTETKIVADAFRTNRDTGKVTHTEISERV